MYDNKKKKKIFRLSVTWNRIDKKVVSRTCRVRHHILITHVHLNDTSLHHVGATRYFCGGSALGITFCSIKFYRSFSIENWRPSTLKSISQPWRRMYVQDLSRRNLRETLTMDDDKPPRPRRPISAAIHGCISRERDFQSRNKTLSRRESTILTLRRGIKLSPF